MAARTIAIGDIHGDLVGLDRVLARLPALDPHDTLLFLGDYVDRGPESAGVVRRLMNLQTEARCVFLRGNHEDAWLKVMDGGLDPFVLERGNGTLQSLRSYRPGRPGELTPDDLNDLRDGSFWPPEVRAWFEDSLYWYEDEHAIYVHGGLLQREGRWLHPLELATPTPCLWQRDPAFFDEYVGKRVVVGHTPTSSLPPGGATSGVWVRDPVWVVDTGASKGGWLSALVLPTMEVVSARGKA